MARIWDFGIEYDSWIGYLTDRQITKFYVRIFIARTVVNVLTLPRRSKAKEVLRSVE